MGVRADFYVGWDKELEWLGSIAWDGSPEDAPRHIFTCALEKDYRKTVANLDGIVTPEQGWPWPWKTSSTTDFAYTFHDGCVWVSSGKTWVRGSAYFDWLKQWRKGEDFSPGDLFNVGLPAIFPEMSMREVTKVTEIRATPESSIVLFGDVYERLDKIEVRLAALEQPAVSEQFTVYNRISSKGRVTPEYVAGLVETLTIERNKSIGLEIEVGRLKAALEIAAEEFDDYVKGETGRRGDTDQLVKNWLEKAKERL